jgi:hypothetical protein
MPTVTMPTLTMPTVTMLPPDGAPPGDAADVLGQVYDPATLAAIDAAAGAVTPRAPATAARGSVPVAGARGRGGLGAMSVAGAVWMGAMVAVDEALGEKPRQPQVAWYVPAPVNPDTEAVSVDLHPGSPATSRVVVRPWLLGGR